MRYLSIIVGYAMLSTQAVGAEPASDRFYCEERGLGEYFYCEKPEPVEETPDVQSKERPEIKRTETKPKDPDIANLEAFQIQLDDARKKAVWNPTDENVRNFMELQIVMADRADEFSGVFSRLGWQNPELSYNVKNPVNRAGLQQFRMAERQARSAHMKGLGDRYGIYYFYSSNCGACQVFSPILKMFSKIHDLDVMAVSMDGGATSVFEWRVDNGISRRLGLANTVTPAVILFDSQEREAIPVSFGVVSVEELEDRIFELTGGETKGFIGEVSTNVR